MKRYSLPLLIGNMAMPTSLRVLLVHNEYGRPSGEEHALHSIAALLEKNGHHVGWFLRSSAEIQSLAGKAKAFLTGLYNPWAGKRMATVLAQNHYDFVLVQNLYPLLSPSVLRACQRQNVPVLMRCPNYRLFCPNALHLSHGRICQRCLGGKEHWCVLRNCEENIFKSLGYALRNAVARRTRSILDSVHLFIVLSEFQKQRFIQAGIPASRLHVLPNMVPKLEPGLAQEPGDLITFVGRVSPEKGIEDFIASARRLPCLPFAVAGATERMPALVASSPPNVRWLGFLGEQRLNDIYAKSRILVFPFRWFEGFPNVLTRAMALEKPVIAARIGAVPEIVHDGHTGLLFEMGNVDGLVATIQVLYPDLPRCRQMGLAGRLKAQAAYSPEVVYTRLLEISQKALPQAV